MKLGGVDLVSALLGACVSLVVCGAALSLVSPLKARPPAPPPEKHSRQEDVALAMMRVGYLDWQMVCAYTLGLSKTPRERVFGACSVDLGVGEPHHFGPPTRLRGSGG